MDTWKQSRPPVCAGLQWHFRVFGGRAKACLQSQLSSQQLMCRMSRLCSFPSRTGTEQSAFKERSKWFTRGRNSNTSCSQVHIYTLHILNNILNRLLWVKSSKICKQMSWRRDGNFVSGCWKWIISSFILHLISNPVPILSFFPPFFPAPQVWSRERIFLQSQPGWLQHHRHSGCRWLRACRVGKGELYCDSNMNDFFLTSLQLVPGECRLLRRLTLIPLHCRFSSRAMRTKPSPWKYWRRGTLWTQDSRSTFVQRNSSCRRPTLTSLLGTSSKELHWNAVQILCMPFFVMSDT